MIGIHLRHLGHQAGGVLPWQVVRAHQIIMTRTGDLQADGVLLWPVLVPPLVIAISKEIRRRLVA